MTKKEKDTLTKVIKELQDWMKDSCGETVQEEELPQMVVDSGDIYEVIANINLSNGYSFTIHNRCFDSFIKGEYCGDSIYVKDDVLFIETWDNGENKEYRYISTPISNVQLLDVTAVKIDWAKLWKNFHAKHPGFTLPKRSDEDSHSVKYWRAKADEAVDELTAMLNGMNDRLSSYLQSAPTNNLSMGLPTTSFITSINPPRLALSEPFEETRGQRGINH